MTPLHWASICAAAVFIIAALRYRESRKIRVAGAMVLFLSYFFLMGPIMYSLMPSALPPNDVEHSEQYKKGWWAGCKTVFDRADTINSFGMIYVGGLTILLIISIPKKRKNSEHAVAE